MNFKNAKFRVTRAVGRALLPCLPNALVPKLADQMLSCRNRLLERSRQIEARKKGDENLRHLVDYEHHPIRRSVLEADEPWAHYSIPECAAPGMLTDAEKRYYQYITRFVDGAGAVLEVGTWLGMSTFYLATGLSLNPRFSGKLICVDDYVWRSSSMTKWIAKLDFHAPENYESFQPIFEEYLRASKIDHLVESRRMKVADYFGNESVASLEWDGKPIEMCIVDCGRTLEVNEGWYRKLTPSFLPNRTLVVMQDWQNHKIVPERFWENTRIFTDGKGDELDLIHEVRDAGIATFLYCGKQ